MTGLFAYNLALLGFFMGALPYYLVRDYRTGRYREAVPEKLGLRMNPSVTRLKGARPVWFHALSVGEVISAKPLIRAFRQRYPEEVIVFSTNTQGGQEIARQILAEWVDGFFFAPLDLPHAVNRVVRRLRPKLYVLIETDIWPNILHYLHRDRIPAVLMNARMSPRSFNGYHRVKSFIGPVLRLYDQILVQAEVERNRFVALGADPRQVLVTGNLKFDQEAPYLTAQEQSRLRLELGITEGRRIVLASSTHDPEDEIILSIFGQLGRKHPGLTLVIAPREKECFESTYRLAKKKGFVTARRTDPGPGDDEPQVLVLDTIGELARVSALAELIFVGGSLADHGGHNILEGAAQGRPVLFGPIMYNFKDMAASMVQVGAGIQVPNPEELASELDRLLTDPETAARMGEQGRNFFFENKGALERNLEVLGKFLATG
ncbi:MAG: 3-deoxy-D-manno-octulosonic acid transferase [Deltaproteobacteria bacterium]|nr:3-deoxy-D-manno-octulosonic acid transferase [Deltaproteobacteria bacterium]